MSADSGFDRHVAPELVPNVVPDSLASRDGQFCLAQDFGDGGYQRFAGWQGGSDGQPVNCSDDNVPGIANAA